MSSVLTPQAENFPQWYQDVVAKAKLAEHGPVRGSMVIRPNGYAIWERIQRELDDRFKEAGVQGAYFPMFIPHSYLEKEAEHVEGFSPELALVTHAGGKEISEPLVVRPTSETVVNYSFARWIQSHRDLPLLVNQWSNVVRWEMRPRLFLRTTEFLWQEGHTCHADSQEAQRFARRIATSVYYEVIRDLMAMPAQVGAKTERERFAGAVHTYTLEAMMRDGKAVQSASSHYLGQNFSRAFGTAYLSESGQQEFVWQTSWGATTRLIGSLIMCHGDDFGLRLPPAIAPTQIVVVPIRQTPEVDRVANQLYAELNSAGVRVRLDSDTSTSFGRRVVDWELTGVPIRIELGPRDVENSAVVIARRDTREKTLIPITRATVHCGELLNQIQQQLLTEATDHRDRHIVEVHNLATAREAAQDGWARLPYDLVRAVEAAGELGEGLSVRCLQRADGSAPQASNEPDLVAFIGRSY